MWITANSREVQDKDATLALFIRLDKCKLKIRSHEKYLESVPLQQYAMHTPGLGRFRVCLVGSTITGFGTDTSDIDMCLLPENQTLQSQLHQQQHHYNTQLRGEALMILNVIHNFLKDLGKFRVESHDTCNL